MKKLTSKPIPVTGPAPQAILGKRIDELKLVRLISFGDLHPAYEFLRPMIPPNCDAYLTESGHVLFTRGAEPVVNAVIDPASCAALKLLDYPENLGKYHQLSLTRGGYDDPPATAKFFLLLMPKRNRDHLIGDLEEEYWEIVLPEYGPRRACLWYWWQVGASLWPLIWAKMKHIAGLILLWKSVR